MVIQKCATTSNNFTFIVHVFFNIQTFLFYTPRNRLLKGIFPKNYVHLITDVEIVRGEYVIKRSEIVDEITKILKEWHEHFKKYFLVSNIDGLLFPLTGLD